MSVMAKYNPLSLEPIPAALDNEWLDGGDRSPGLRFEVILYNYVRKLDEAEWVNLEIGMGEQLWVEAKHQAKIIENRLIEIEGDTSLGAGRERVFLQCYARRLLSAYRDDEPQVPGVPIELIRILEQEFLGLAAAMKLLAHEEKRPGQKIHALYLVKRYPNMLQGELARRVEVSNSTIRAWAPELRAAGWMGTELDRKAAAKGEEPLEPDSPEPSTPSLAKLKFMEGKEPEDD